MNERTVICTIDTIGREQYLVITNTPYERPDEDAAMRVQITDSGKPVSRDAVLERLSTLLVNGKYDGLVVPIASVLKVVEDLLSQPQK
ncbi:hypothetical protein C5B42_03560 [Candidatus Cerribacteria bacterium 'Amazon FNV 2010 28 9']|uniref:Uncharacterized protein n=1 Tax=Candidatus Cerribacteria bacterium 'Amazon FNV 2010 28 9' TaxID=2081795 RepID=A0A317JN83_9BACT|nr:MAG: hypothetical protein C5B42_03560 [Candidatus Cerribacteria bacterium 'Amazon FNV 2010 28 9']